MVMFTWIAQNAATLILSALLIGVLALVVRKLVRDRRAGKSSCGCGCDSCASKGMCHKP